METAAFIADVVLILLLAGVLFGGRRVGQRLGRRLGKTETAVATLGTQVTEWLDADHRRVVREYAWRQLAERDTVDLRATIEKAIGDARWQGYRANLVDSHSGAPIATAGELFRDA